MKIRELNEKIKEINPNWAIYYSEYMDYTVADKLEGEHTFRLDVLEKRDGARQSVLTAGIDEDAKPYVNARDYHALDKSEIKELAKLLVFLQDLLEDFGGYID